MELKDLRYIVTIAEEQSFTRAAEKLFISQPALSLCVQRLEKELNTKLFIRDRNKLVITPAGSMLIEDGRYILNLTQKMSQKIFDVINFDKGIIRVGLSQFYSRYYSPQLFSSFHSHYPAVKFEIIEDFSIHLEDYLLHDEIDLAIIPLPVQSSDILYESLFQEKIYLAVPKELELMTQETGGIPMIDPILVKDQPFIMLKKYQKIRKISDSICEESGFTPQILLETQDMNTINNFVAMNLGVGFVSDIIERNNYMQKDKVNYYQLKSSKATRTFVITYKKNAVLSPASRNFIRLAHDFFGSN